MKKKVQPKTIVKSNSTALKLGALGVSLAGLTTAYYFLGPKGQKHQKQTKAWAEKMKSDILTVAAEYKKGTKGSNKEVTALVRNLKKHWKTLHAIPKA